MKALDQLGLDDSVDMAAIKARYKDLVKRLHPDANAGDRSNEDKLREIIRAYNYLRSVKLCVRLSSRPPAIAGAGKSLARTLEAECARGRNKG